MNQQEIEVIAEVVDQAVGKLLAERMEQVYGVIEELRQEVGQAVSQVRDTAQVLHDNDTALMARLTMNEGSVPGEVVRQAAEAWEHFIRGECERLGWRIVKPKGAAPGPFIAKQGADHGIEEPDHVG